MLEAFCDDMDIADPALEVMKYRDRRGGPDAIHSRPGSDAFVRSTARTNTGPFELVTARSAIGPLSQIAVADGPFERSTGASETPGPFEARTAGVTAVGSTKLALASHTGVAVGLHSE